MPASRSSQGERVMHPAEREAWPRPAEVHLLLRDAYCSRHEDSQQLTHKHMCVF